MIRNLIRIASFSLAAFVLATSLCAQGWPLPARTPNTPVLCDPAIWSACLDPNTGKLTPGWDLPIRSFVGRYIDSVQTRPYQQGFRTARGMLLRTSPKRVYLETGSAVFAYDINTFASRLANSEPLVPATSIPVSGTWRTGTPENILRWDQFFNAEGSSWNTVNADGWQRLYDIDFDDRGYLYLAYSEFGWGVVKDDFKDGADWMTSAFQQFPSLNLWPTTILSVKTTDGRYFAIVSDRGTTSQLWFMGDSNGFQHSQNSNLNFGLARWAKSSDGTRVAIVDWGGSLRIYRNDDLVAGGAPISTFGSGFTDVTSDGTNFFGVRAMGVSGMTVVTPSGGTYTANDYNFSWSYNSLAVISPTIHYGGGIIAISGKELGLWNIHLFQVSNLVPTEIVGKDNKPTRYFLQYYAGADGFALPLANLYEAAPYKLDGKVYLVIAGYALSDVYEIAGGNALSARMTSPAAGPYYGDKITVTSSAASTPIVNWSFGDGMPVSTAVPGSPGYPDVSHQYSGRTAATLPATYQVTATNQADPTATDSFSVTMQAPRAGFMVKGHPELLFRQPDASSAAPIVTGDQFVDVGDGMAGGHYVDWTSTAVPAVQTGSGGSIAVGTCGANQVSYTVHYGPFDSTVTPFSIAAGSEAKYSINSFNYSVRPFAPAVTRTLSDTAMTFTTVARAGTGVDLPAGGATACTYLYELMNASNVVVNTMGGSATLATIPSYQATKATGLVDGPMHLRLTITVDPTALSSACASFNSVLSTLDFDGTLIPPPGACGSINDNSAYVGFFGSATGCTPAHGTCSTSDTLTFNAYPNLPFAFACATGYSYSWSFGDGQMSQISNPTHQYTSNSTFNVTLVITDGSNAKGTYHATVSVNGVSPNPNPNPSGCGSLNSQSAYIGFYGSATGCTPANSNCSSSDLIYFSAYGQGGYVFSCTPYTWSWNFGDGASSTLDQPTHQFMSGGSYNVLLTITDSSGRAAQVTKAVTINGPSNPNPGSNPTPNPGGCAPITPTSAYVGFYGGGTGCTPANDMCTNGETIAFTLYPQNGYSFICSPFSYVWSFGDGKTSTDEQPTHIYATAGTYNISVSVRDSTNQSTTISATIKVGNGSGGGPSPGQTPPHRRPSGHH